MIYKSIDADIDLLIGYHYLWDINAEMSCFLHSKTYNMYYVGLCRRKMIAAEEGEVNYYSKAWEKH